MCVCEKEIVCKTNNAVIWNNILIQCRQHLQLDEQPATEVGPTEEEEQPAEEDVVETTEDLLIDMIGGLALY